MTIVKNISLIAALLWACSSAPATDGMILRFGHFPNVTHAQALVAHSLSRQGKGWFEQRLGPEVEVHWFVYNAGPSAMEALFAGSLDVSYVGPSPALNAYARSHGEEVRAIAGATIGGSALVVQPDGRIKQPEDFRGKKVATPQLREHAGRFVPLLADRARFQNYAAGRRRAGHSDRKP